LNYYRARYYDSRVGRFISVDPMGFDAGDTNLYRYVGNNSTNATDPTGLFSWDETLYSVDKFVAGFADVASFGATTRLREELYGDRVAGQHEGALFNVGQFAGAAALTAIGLGAAKTGGWAGSFLNGAAKGGLSGAGFGAISGAGMSLLNDLDRGGINGNSFGKALTWAKDGAIGGYKFGSQFGASASLGLLGRTAQTKMLFDGTVSSTMAAIDHFERGEYWSGTGELFNAFSSAKNLGKNSGQLIADAQTTPAKIQSWLANIRQQGSDRTHLTAFGENIGGSLEKGSTSIPRQGKRLVLNQLNAPENGNLACGPYSCAMVLDTYGLKYDAGSLIKETRLPQNVKNGVKGTYPNNLSPTLRNNGLESARSVRTSIANLKKATSYGHPAIALLSLQIGNHYVVVDGFTVKNGQEVVAIRDPAGGRQYFTPINDFQARFTGHAILTNPNKN
jgi:hypothetical protein